MATVNDILGNIKNKSLIDNILQNNAKPDDPPKKTRDDFMTLGEYYDYHYLTNGVQHPDDRRTPQEMEGQKKSSRQIDENAKPSDMQIQNYNNYHLKYNRNHPGDTRTFDEVTSSIAATGFQQSTSENTPNTTIPATTHAPNTVHDDDNDWFANAHGVNVTTSTPAENPLQGYHTPREERPIATYGENSPIVGDLRLPETINVKGDRIVMPGEEKEWDEHFEKTGNLHQKDVRGKPGVSSSTQNPIERQKAITSTPTTPTTPVVPTTTYQGGFGNEPIKQIGMKPVVPIPMPQSDNLFGERTMKEIDTRIKKDKQDNEYATLMDEIKAINAKDRKKVGFMNTMKTIDSASSLLNNLTEGDGITPIEGAHLVSPEAKYDDTLRRAVASEAMKSGQIAQSNAMKLGMGGLIPAIQNNALKATNEANTQAQAQLNQIQQQNAMMGAQTANNEQQLYIQQRDKIIQDALQKNNMRYQAIGQSKDALWKDINRGMEQNQLYKDADIQTKLYEYMKANPGTTNEQLQMMLQQFGFPTDMIDTKSRSKSSGTDDFEERLEKYIAKKSKGN
jgi:hypothetical protein